VSAGEKMRSAWSLVAGVVAGVMLTAFVGADGAVGPKQALSVDKAWPGELPADQDEALYDLCLANGGPEPICDAQRRVILALHIGADGWRHAVAWHMLTPVSIERPLAIGMLRAVAWLRTEQGQRRRAHRGPMGT
jgi:hypothetical protein